MIEILLILCGSSAIMAIIHIIFIINKIQLKENIDAFEIEWDDELEAAVNKIHRENPSPAP